MLQDATWTLSGDGVYVSEKETMNMKRTKQTFTITITKDINYKAHSLREIFQK